LEFRFGAGGPEFQKLEFRTKSQLAARTKNTEQPILTLKAVIQFVWKQIPWDKLF
jgi:hypothetical protein